MTLTRRGVDPIGETRSLLDEFERAGEVEGVVDRVQVVEVRRLGELDQGQPVPSVIRVQQVAGEGQQLAVIFAAPVVVDGIEFLGSLVPRSAPDRRASALRLRT